MTLCGLLNKKTIRVLGINSGTSADGIDMAVVRVTLSRKPSVEYLQGAARRYPSELKDLVLKAASSAPTTSEAVIYLDNLLGDLYGQAASRYIARLDRLHISVDAVASHGQTIRHLPEQVTFGGRRVRGTLQIGSLDQIAARTGKVTVGDFRQADVAIGHEGAPITVAAMGMLFGCPGESRLIVNIGGIANYFYLPGYPDERRIRAADCGPGNSLLDLLSRALFDEPFDRAGQHAATGVISQRLLSILLAHPFFADRAVSTGREAFGFDLARQITEFGRQFSMLGADMLATAGELTAAAIANSISPLLARDRRLRKIYLTGGGRRNRFVVERLRMRLGGISVGTVDELGVRGDFVEAAAYAVMGAMTLWSRPLRTRFSGGAQSVRPILGKIVQPPVRGRRL